MLSLKPEVSLGTSVALIGLDLAIYSTHLPSSADVRSTAPHNQAIDTARKSATWTAIGVAAALSLMTRDPNLFIFGGGAAVAMDWLYRHANAVHPMSGQVSLPPDGGMVPTGVAAAGVTN